MSLGRGFETIHEEMLSALNTFLSSLRVFENQVAGDGLVPQRRKAVFKELPR